MPTAVRIRGGGGPAAPSSKRAAATTSTDPAAKNKKVRITAFDSMRFFLIMLIVLGHFVRFANPSDFWLRFFSQHNAVVGAFFALSGYVTAYTSTENAKPEASPRLTDTPKQKWILSRIFGYYPLHLLVLLLFSPIFLYADVSYNGWPVTLWHGLLSVTLTQAWFPMHAEIWNAPTWFLSSLNFATAIIPFGLPPIAKMTKRQLRRTMWWTFLATYFLPKLGYCYDFNTWNLFEGMTAPKAHPNLAVFNMQRFQPAFCAAEVLLGAIACRLVMMDGATPATSDDKKQEAPPKTNALSTAVPLVSMFGLMWARAAGVVPPLNDLLFRCLFFVPLFLRFLMATHRNTVNGTPDPTIRFLSTKFLVALGNLSFPIYIVHGPMGQMFYKKIIATKLFGSVLKGPANFGIYLASTMAVAWILQKTFLQNKAVSNWSKKTVEQWSTWM